MSTRPEPVRSLRNFKPRSVDPGAGWVLEQTLGDLAYPKVIVPAVEGVVVSHWVGEQRERIRSILDTAGALLLRGFDVVSPEAFRRIVTAFDNRTMEYIDRSSPRTGLGDGVYTSTEHPADQSIHLHNELAYSQSWPSTVAFFCHVPATEGGETPLADVRRVHDLLSPSTRALFSGGVMYRRNLMPGVGLPWQEVFQTTDRARVEESCRERGVEFEWRGRGLMIRWIRPAILMHPRTGEPVWFNHGYFFNSRTLDDEVRRAFASDDDLSFETCLADRSPIPADVFNEIGEAYREAALAFEWKRGDVLILDNMLVAHGRRPFRGPREVQVMMCGPLHD